MKRVRFELPAQGWPRHDDCGRIAVSGRCQLRSLEKMKPTYFLASVLVSWPIAAAASPSPVLPWATASVRFALESGPVELRMECPGGVLQKLSAVRGQQVAELPISRLAALSLSPTCAGASTRAEMEEEGSRTIKGLTWQVQLSHEYIVEELWIAFDLQRFEFTEARHLMTYPGEATEVKRVDLR